MLDPQTRRSKTNFGGEVSEDVRIQTHCDQFLGRTPELGERLAYVFRADAALIAVFVRP